MSIGSGLTMLPGPLFAADSGSELDIKALTFDVFGTVVDWRASIIREGQLLAARKGYDIDWASFADSWRSGYGPAMNRVRNGDLPWTKIDDLHRMILDELVLEYELEGMSEAELDHFNRAWHRLSPWPDTVAGLNRLKTMFVYLFDTPERIEDFHPAKGESVTDVAWFTPKDAQRAVTHRSLRPMINRVRRILDPG